MLFGPSFQQVTLSPQLANCTPMLGADFACPAFGDLQQADLDVCQLSTLAAAEAACKAITGCVVMVNNPRFEGGGTTLKSDVEWPARIAQQCSRLSMALRRRAAAAQGDRQVDVDICLASELSRWHELGCGSEGRAAKSVMRLVAPRPPRMERLETRNYAGFACVPDMEPSPDGYLSGSTVAVEFLPLQRSHAAGKGAACMRIAPTKDRESCSYLLPGAHASCRAEPRCHALRCERFADHCQALELRPSEPTGWMSHSWSPHHFGGASEAARRLRGRAADAASMPPPLPPPPPPLRIRELPLRPSFGDADTYLRINGTWLSGALDRASPTSFSASPSALASASASSFSFSSAVSFSSAAVVPGAPVSLLRYGARCGARHYLSTSARRESRIHGRPLDLRCRATGCDVRPASLEAVALGAARRDECVSEARTSGPPFCRARALIRRQNLLEASRCC